MPGPDEGFWKIALRRLELMLWALICPELIITWAFKQWVAARCLRDEYGGLGWTKTHGYFLQMGGFMLMDGDERKGVLTPGKLHNLLRKGEIALPSITEEEIQDRSKADGLAKGIAVLQTTWFIAQCLSRPAQGLIITEIELITLAIAALNGLLYFLWWNKPLDVRCCVPVLSLHGEDLKPVEIPPFEPKKWSQIFSSIFSWVHIRWLLNSLGHLRGYMAQGTITCANLKRAKMALLELLIFPFRMFGVLFERGSEIFESSRIDEGAIRVPTFYAHPKLRSTDEMVMALSLIIAMLFGGIHCAGWNFPFPSHAELIIWRVSSLIILIVPCTTALVLAMTTVKDRVVRVIIGGIAVFASLLGLMMYVPARLTLFVEAFLALRHLPPGAYSVVDWTALLLHM